MTMIPGPQGRLFVDDAGAGNAVPVLFVHSGGGNTTHWAAQLAHSRETRRAIALDLRGHGRSEPPRDGRYAVDALAVDVAAVADARGLGRYVVVGHSLGGAAAVAHAAARPDRVAGLFLLDPASDGRAIPPAEAAGLMQALRSDAYLATVDAYWATLMTESTPEVQARLLVDLHATRREAITGTLEGLLSFDPVTPLRAYRGPRLAVTTRLNETPAAYHALVPELPRRHVDGVGHWLQLDAPARVNALLDEFLAGAR